MGWLEVVFRSEAPTTKEARKALKGAGLRHLRVGKLAQKGQITGARWRIIILKFDGDSDNHTETVREHLEDNLGQEIVEINTARERRSA